MKTIADYIAQAPQQTRGKLREMRAIVRKAMPRAVEEIKWGMPAFSGERRIGLMFGGFTHHIGLYPTPAVLAAFRKELTPYVHARGSVQFPLAHPLPKGLIGRMARLRARQMRLEDAVWRSKQTAKTKKRR